MLLLMRMLGLLVRGVELRNWLESKSIVAVVANIGEGRATHHLILVRPRLTLVGGSPRLVLDKLWFVGGKLWCVHLLLWVIHVTEQRASGRVAVVECERAGRLLLLLLLCPGAIGDVLRRDDDSVIVLVVVWMVRVVEDADRLVFDDLFETKVHDGLVGGRCARGRVVRVRSIGVKVQTIHDGGIKRF